MERQDWPYAQYTFTDPDSDSYGQTVEFPYCCWTFCAWPDLLNGLVVRWHERGISVRVQQCRQCPAALRT
jgi:hypothetical protein